MVLVAAPAPGFVLLSGPTEARLVATREDPTVTFHTTGLGPKVGELEQYRDGALADLPDEDTWRQLILDAMSLWNGVQGSYLRLDLSDAPRPDLQVDPEDQLHVITVGESETTTSAVAMPQIEGDLIVDCDIQVGDRTVDAQALVYTLAHELGHCLGLGHNHASYQSIMSYARTSYTLKLGADDVAGAVYLYPRSTEDAAVSHLPLACGTVAAPDSGAKRRVLSWVWIALPLAWTCLRARGRRRRGRACEATGILI